MPTFNTPMMQQYQAIKEQYQDCLLFFRLGDFYELFLEDAKVGSKVLEITLTKRPRGKDGEIPMAGVPYHAADIYIARLVKKGFKVAICEQVSEPDNKGIVEREVVRIVTPGTILDEKTLDKKEHNYLMSISFGKEKIGLAAADLSTGDFLATEVDNQDNYFSLLNNEIARFNPSECILNQENYNNPELLKQLTRQKSLNIYFFDNWDELAGNATDYLQDNFQVASLEVFGLANKPEAVKAAASLLGYLKETQKGQINHLKTIRLYNPEEYLTLDHSTIYNLEIFDTLRAREDKGSLLEVLDKTVTAMGGRLLREWLRKPLISKEAIEERLAAVEELLNNQTLRQSIREILKQICDISRLVSRLSVGVGNAYDLKNLEGALRQAVDLKKNLADLADNNSNDNFIHTQPPLPPPVRGATHSPLSGGARGGNIFDQINQTISPEINNLIELINYNIIDNPPLDPKGGGLINNGFSKELDELREQIGGSKDWILKMEMQEREKTGINSLKIKFNKVFGYYIEISHANSHLVPKYYLRKQTLVNAERFITPELKEYEEKILAGEEIMNRWEYEFFLQTVQQVLIHTEQLQNLARQLGILDCLAGLAQIAERENYVKPEIAIDDELEIIAGRHPVVEKWQNEPFIPNDVKLNSKDHQLLVITGPNMAGKSVFMRQVAVITLMAHIGSFVPAQKAKISLVDQIFVRSGAADFIASGLSTFMVEMVETAHILNQATNKSLIIMDEIGRGTSTYDGISIAWAIAEYLVTNKKLQTKTLFATHYHELQLLEDNFPEQIKNYCVLVKEKSDGEPIFLHQVVRGSASHSYAVAVAKLAGVPKTVTTKANQILKQLEKRNFQANNQESKEKLGAVLNSQMTVKEEREEYNKNLPNQELLEEIANLDIYNMTPMEALNKLVEIKGKVEKE